LTPQEDRIYVACENIKTKWGEKTDSNSIIVDVNTLQPIEYKNNVFPDRLLSPDGRYYARIATSYNDYFHTYDQALTLWDANTFQQIGKPLVVKSRVGQYELIQKIKFSPDGSMLAIIDYDVDSVKPYPTLHPKVSLYSVENRSLIGIWRPPTPTGWYSGVNSLAFDNTSQYLLVFAGMWKPGNQDSSYTSIRVLNIPSFNQVYEYPQIRGSRSLEVSSDNAYIISEWGTLTLLKFKTSSVKESLPEKSDIEIQYNTTSGQLLINPHITTGAEITIVDVLGKIIFRYPTQQLFENQQLNLQIPKLPVGVYIVNVNYGKKNVSTKIIIN
jgi:hypothetical protein